MAELDYQMALVLQHKFEQELKKSRHSSQDDFLIAKELQEQFKSELETDHPSNNLVYQNKSGSKNSVLNTSKCLIDPSWEVVDPTPDVHVLFMAFDEKFFWKALATVSVSWSKRMTTCAGICSYEGRGGMCKITLSEPLLKLRPRKDLVETLLHEMIHAYLFVTNNNKDRDGHGPEFHKHMYRINKESGTNITVYHDFHDEVRLYQQHWWRCDGPCQKWKPYFGMVRRATNRAPGPNDRWWGEHSRNCGGNFIKVKEPEKNNTKESQKSTKGSSSTPVSTKNSITNYFPSKSTTPNQASSSSTNIHTVSKDNVSQSSSKIQNVIPSKSSNIYGFSNLNGGGNTKKPSTSSSSNFVKGAVKNNSNTIVINKKPSTKDSVELPKPVNTNIEIFAGSGCKLTDHSQSSSISNDYSTVRDHWLKKYGDNSNKKSGKRINSDKSLVSPKNKVPKVDNKKVCDKSAECPICKKQFPVAIINDHLDKCLETPKENDTQHKECIICENMVLLSEYELHVSKCASDHFGDNNDDDVFEVKVCPKCNTDISFSKTHNCISSSNSQSTSTSQENDKIDCLACGKKIHPSELNDHLDDCFNLSNVFNNSDIPVEGGSEEKESETQYNCPFCMRLFKEGDMNKHLDVCLQTKDDSKEVEDEKSVLLNSFSADDTFDEF